MVSVRQKKKGGKKKQKEKEKRMHGFCSPMVCTLFSVGSNSQQFFFFFSDRQSFRMLLIQHLDLGNQLACLHPLHGVNKELEANNQVLFWVSILTYLNLILPRYINLHISCFNALLPTDICMGRLPFFIYW